MPDTVVLEIPARTRPPRWKRNAYAAGAWVLIITVGRFIIPTPSRAAPNDPAPIAPLSLGTIVCPEYRVEILSSPTGPVYTVRNAAGKVLGERLNAESLASRFPHLNPAGLNAQADRTILHAGAED